MHTFSSKNVIFGLYSLRLYLFWQNSRIVKPILKIHNEKIMCGFCMLCTNFDIVLEDNLIYKYLISSFIQYI